MATHRRFTYVRAPLVKPAVGCCRLVKAPMPSPVDGEVLVLTHYLSIDPYTICGQISQYNVPRRRGPRNVGVILDKGITVEGFRTGNHLARRDQALDELMTWFRAGRLKFRERVAEGFDAAPAAPVNMLSGGSIGKQVVRLAAAAARWDPFEHPMGEPVACKL